MTTNDTELDNDIENWKIYKDERFVFLSHPFDPNPIPTVYKENKGIIFL